jgi:DNA-binding LacI/PurR family transcriptional regulator
VHSGDKRPTLADVAARAGVSTALVSIVMRDVPGASAATRRRVLAVAEELGYHPDARARLLRSGRSKLLGVVFGVQNPYHGDLVTGLYDAAEKIGYELTLSAVTPHRDEEHAVGGLLQDRCEALILIGPLSPSAALAKIAARLPVVVLARSVRNRAVDTVRTDDGQGLRQAVDHLVGLGHRRIAHIDGGAMLGSADRRRGFLEAMAEHGLERQAQVLAGGMSEEDGARVARELLADPPTAVSVFNDRSATGVLDVLHRSGLRVPEDISVVGYDDERVARLAHIDLTTVAQDTAAMTMLAAARAVDRIEGVPVQERELVIPPRLVVRGTTGPAAH